MSTTNVQVRSGNRCIVLCDGVDVGLLQSVTPNDDYSPEPASGIGDIHVQENVPTLARHSISVSQMVLYKTNMRTAKISVENGDDALQGRVFDIQILDKPGGQVLTTYIGCSYASGGVEVRKHAIVMANATFLALDRTGAQF